MTLWRLLYLEESWSHTLHWLIYFAWEYQGNLTSGFTAIFQKTNTFSAASFKQNIVISDTSHIGSKAAYKKVKSQVIQWHLIKPSCCQMSLPQVVVRPAKPRNPGIELSLCLGSHYSILTKRRQMLMTTTPSAHNTTPQ